MPVAAPESPSVASRAEQGCLFPHFVCRVGGLPVDRMAALRGEETCAELETFYGIEEKLRRHKESLAQLLYEAVGSAQNKNRRGALLQLKRDVYNRRSLDADDVSKAQEGATDQVAEALRAYQQLREERWRVRQQVERSYRNERTSVRRTFQSLVEDKGFQKGLLISSRSLFSAQERYLGATEDLSGKQANIERGLLRYFSRTAMKATPFGTFCAVLPGQLSEAEAPGAEQPLFALQGDPGAKQSRIRLNKALFGILKAHVKEQASIRRHLPVELNPTLRSEEDRLLFLASVEGREVFQRVPENPVLGLIGDALDEHAHLPLQELVEALHGHPGVDASEEEAVAYLDKLLEIGFIRFRLGIPEQEVDWDLPLRELLEPVDDEHAREIVSLLETLRRKIEAYGIADVGRRRELLDEMDEAIEDAFEAMDLDVRVRKDLPFYEDATADATAQLSRSALSQICDDLREFVGLTLPMTWPRRAQATMRHFFDTYYEGQPSVPLLTFYEDYYRGHFKEHLEKQRNVRRGGDDENSDAPNGDAPRDERNLEEEDLEEERSDEDADGYNLSNPFDLDLVTQIRDAQTELQNLISMRWHADPSADEISLEAQDVKKALEDVPSPSNTDRSVSLFAQPVPPSGEKEPAQLIVPQATYYAGYGKYFSRFLPLFPDDVQAELYEANEHLTSEHLAEICGDAHFNANLHPPLISREISYPTGESGEAEAQLLSADLYVEPAPDDPHALCLRHAPTGKRVLPVDLGFLNPRMRPPLYQLLSRFTPVANFRLPVPWKVRSPEEIAEAEKEEAEDEEAEEEPVQQEDEEEPEIRRRPRVTYNDTLVLARRAWRVPSALFPERGDRETDAEYFIRANRWRREHGIPREAYVRLRPLPVPPEEREEEAQQEDTDSEEPEAEKAEREAAEQEEGEVETDEDGDTRQRRTRPSRDLHKPQYIDFSNPLLVNLLGKMTVNLRHFAATFAERYPGAEALPRHDGATYTNELILQLDFPREKADQDDVSAMIQTAQT